MRRLVLVLLLVCGLVAAPAHAARKLHVGGPRTVRVGQEVVFPTTGFRPHERITVNLAPTITRGGNCCGIDVIEGARADADGKALLHFRWPSYYLNGDEHVAWRKGSRADVLVMTPRYARGRRVVRVRG